jgi:hypothetical protein
MCKMGPSFSLVAILKNIFEAKTMDQWESRALASELIGIHEGRKEIW